jgi:hypothetical protein
VNNCSIPIFNADSFEVSDVSPHTEQMNERIERRVTQAGACEIECGQMLRRRIERRGRRMLVLILILILNLVIGSGRMIEAVRWSDGGKQSNVENNQLRQIFRAYF